MTTNLATKFRWNLSVPSWDILLTDRHDRLFYNNIINYFLFYSSLLTGTESMRSTTLVRYQQIRVHVYGDRRLKGLWSFSVPLVWRHTFMIRLPRTRQNNQTPPTSAFHKYFPTSNASFPGADVWFEHRGDIFNLLWLISSPKPISVPFGFVNFPTFIYSKFIF